MIRATYGTINGLALGQVAVVLAGQEGITEAAHNTFYVAAGQLGKSKRDSVHVRTHY